MRTLRRFLKRLFSWASQRQDEERLKSEIEEHLALQTAENLRAGLSPVEARRQARAEVRSGGGDEGDYRDQKRTAVRWKLCYRIRATRCGDCERPRRSPSQRF